MGTVYKTLITAIITSALLSDFTCKTACASELKGIVQHYQNDPGAGDKKDNAEEKQWQDWHAWLASSLFQEYLSMLHRKSNFRMSATASRPEGLLLESVKHSVNCSGWFGCPNVVERRIMNFDTITGFRGFPFAVQRIGMDFDNTTLVCTGACSGRGPFFFPCVRQQPVELLETFSMTAEAVSLRSDLWLAPDARPMTVIMSARISPDSWLGGGLHFTSLRERSTIYPVPGEN